MTYATRPSRLNSLRRPGWDYSSPASYFITVCTRKFAPVFGEVEDGLVRLSRSGRIVAEEWQRTGELRPNVELGDWVIMPDHLHAIIRIRETSTLMSGSLGTIVGQFKGMCTRRIRAGGHTEFAWHRGFYDRIIHSRLALDRVRAYIARNPEEWKGQPLRW